VTDFSDFGTQQGEMRAAAGRAWQVIEEWRGAAGYKAEVTALADERWEEAYEKYQAQAFGKSLDQLVREFKEEDADGFNYVRVCVILFDRLYQEERQLEQMQSKPPSVASSFLFSILILGLLIFGMGWSW
jgi:hypothetical protein